MDQGRSCHQLIDFAVFPASLCRDNFDIQCLCLSWYDICASFSRILGFWNGKKAATVEDLILERYVFALCWDIPAMGSTLEHLSPLQSDPLTLDISNVKYFFHFSHSLLGHFRHISMDINFSDVVVGVLQHFSSGNSSADIEELG
ncbi:hypothetical protein L1049_009643 [Liquidambar formosana]|uniref:Uncharacterized protein n=1 Tax=Liquidambar formosana TaxID=63359 RepID=A0AAP0R0Q9_LIQFO